MEPELQQAAPEASPIPTASPTVKESSYTVWYQMHQFSFNFVFSICLWWAFFTPIVSNDYLENAFGLPYIGLHALCFYAGLGIFFLTSYPIYWFGWSRKSAQK